MKIKSLLWAVIIFMIGVVMLQNSDTFFRKVPIRLNLVLFRFDLENLPVGVIAIVFFLFGYLISMTAVLAERHRLKATVDTIKEVIAVQSGRLQPDDTIHGSTTMAEPKGLVRTGAETTNTTLPLNSLKRNES